MKPPAKVMICGSEWRVLRIPKGHGGSFASSKKEIRISKETKYVDEIFLHEVIEAIFANRGMRYDKYDLERNGDFLFSFTHEQFEMAIRDIACALKDSLNP